MEFIEDNKIKKIEFNELTREYRIRKRSNGKFIMNSLVYIPEKYEDQFDTFSFPEYDYDTYALDILDNCKVLFEELSSTYRTDCYIHPEFIKLEIKKCLNENEIKNKIASFMDEILSIELTNNSTIIVCKAPATAEDHFPNIADKYIDVNHFGTNNDHIRVHSSYMNGNLYKRVINYLEYGCLDGSIIESGLVIDKESDEYLFNYIYSERINDIATELEDSYIKGDHTYEFITSDIDVTGCVVAASSYFAVD